MCEDGMATRGIDHSLLLYFRGLPHVVGEEVLRVNMVYRYFEAEQNYVCF